MGGKTFESLCLAFTVPSSGCMEERSIPSRPPRAQSLEISFNNERLKAYYLVLDARGAREQQEDREAAGLKGPVIVFFQGHAQRPTDAYAFTSKLARLSRSGIVVVPVCDTPYGADIAWRGDSGKDAILMEILRYALALRGIRVNRFSPLSGNEVRVGSGNIDDGKCPVGADLIAAGWSHGGILARRFAHTYPASVSGLGQVCPAGYEALKPLHLTGRFALESFRISKLTASGHAKGALRSAWGFTKGFVGDFARSLPSAVVHSHPAKAIRVARDIRDCSIRCDSALFGLGPIAKVLVIFGRNDTCMDPKRILGIDGLGAVTGEALDRFRQEYFADTLSPDTQLGLEVLPGTHLAPVTHSDLYARTLLERLGQLAGS